MSSIVRVTQAFAVPAEQVYDAWLDPAIASQFLFATPKGEMLRCEIEPVVGKGFSITERRPLDDDAATIDIEHAGRYLQLERPRRIAFGFSVPSFTDTETMVVVDITAESRGCSLTLRHDLGSGADAEEGMDRTREGWARILAKLAETLQKQ